MILFLQTMARYPNISFDVNTKNTSFVKLAQKYKAMGIKNWYFILATIHPNLVGVDPYDPNLDAATKNDIILECRDNPWYYLREVVRVPPQAGSLPVMFEANRGNIALFFCFFAHLIPFLVQPRQTGKSLSVRVLMNLLLFVMCNNSTINLITKDERAREDEVDNIKALRDLLPDYFVRARKDDANNTHEVTCKALGNEYKTAVGQSSAAAANKVGRGSTAPVAQSDEGPFTNNIQVIMPAMFAAGGAARDEARLTGNPFGSIITTTAGDLDSKEGIFMHELLHGGVLWGEWMFDCEHEAELHRIVKANSAKKDGLFGVVNITLSHLQLGKSDAWMAQKLSEVPITPDAANRDYFNIWTAGNARSPLSKALNTEIRKSRKEPLRRDVSKDGFIFNWYISEAEYIERCKHRKFVMGMDTADAIGSDAISMVMVDSHTLEVVGASACNEANLSKFSGYVADFLIKHEHVILIPERRMNGQVFIDTLLERLSAVGIDPFKRIYTTIIEDNKQDDETYQMAVQPMARRPHWFHDSVRRHFGYVTAHSGRHSRSLLYGDTLQLAAMKSCTLVNDTRLANEILGLVEKNDRIDHKLGGHDDMVIAWLLAVWMLALSRNLQHYGITGALSRTTTTTVTGEVVQPQTPEELRVIEQNAQRREMIECMMEELKTTSDETIVMRLEAKIRMLDRRCGGDGVGFTESNAVDVLMQEARAIRAKRTRDTMRARHSNNAGFFRMAA